MLTSTVSNKWSYKWWKVHFKSLVLKFQVIQLSIKNLPGIHELVNLGKIFQGKSGFIEKIYWGKFLLSFNWLLSFSEQQLSKTRISWGLMWLFQDFVSIANLNKTNCSKRNKNIFTMQTFWSILQVTFTSLSHFYGVNTSKLQA